MRSRSREADARAISHHYDVSNEFYALFLDPLMAYTCAYYRDPDGKLEQAQRDKLELVCRKLELKAGETLLDIGCGWGSLSIWAAQHYGVRAHGVTLSRAQADYAAERIKRPLACNPAMKSMNDRLRRAVVREDRRAGVKITAKTIAAMERKVAQLAQKKGAAFARKAKTLVVTRSDLIDFYPGGDITEDCTQANPKRETMALAVSFDGKLAAAALDGIVLYDTATGKQRAKRSRHTGTTLSLAFTADGRFVLSTGASDKCVRFWKVPAE